MSAESTLRKLLPYSSAGLVIAILYVAWTFFSRWHDTSAVVRTADAERARADAKIVEDYPDAKRGPSVLVHCAGRTGRPLHATLAHAPQFGARLVSVDPAPALKLACGNVAKSSLKFHDVSLKFDDFAVGFACASLLAQDGLPIASSKRLLFTIAGRAQNAQRPKSAEATAVGALGEGPALAQYVPVTLTLPLGTWRAEALDARGASVHSVPVVVAGSESTLSTTLQGAALSYAITR